MYKFDKASLALYLVSDTSWLTKSLESSIEDAIEGGVTFVQYRDKRNDPDYRKSQATKLKELCLHKKIPFVVNDDIDLCLAMDADGIHIGQHDLTLSQARAMLGPNKIIGVSVQSVEQALQAQQDGATYLGVGAMFQTTTKNDAVLVSMDTLHAICNAVDIPVVAIGGIDSTSLSKLQGSGVDGVAVVSAILAQQNIKQASNDLRQQVSTLLQPTKVPVVLSIAGSDCSGGAGIQADIKTIGAHKAYAMSVLSVLTAQNTLGVSAIQEIPVEFVKQQLDAIFEDILPDAIKIGMLYSKEIMEVVVQKLKQYQNIPVVLDPVMISTSNHSLVDREGILYLKENLIPLAAIVTPNLYEAEVLSNTEIKTKDDMVAAAQIIAKDTKASVLIKGGHLLDCADDLLYDTNQVIWLNASRIETTNTHGTGCTLSSAIACGVAQGLTLIESTKQAKSYVRNALSAQLNLGHGNGPIDHFYP